MSEVAEELLFLDTSAWARYLRRRGWDDLKDAVDDALVRRQIATCWVVNAELLIGTPDEAAFNDLLERMTAVAEIPITEVVWHEAARLGYQLRRRGVTIAVPDLVIAQCAIESGRVLWHVDQDFERIREHSALQTRYWQEATS